MKKILICGTHIYQYNGYSKIIYEMLNHLGIYKDIHITLFGFQNFFKGHIQHMKNRILEYDNIDIIDPFFYETFNKTNKDIQQNTSLNNGFGEFMIVDIITLCKPDIVIIYNDPGVINNLYRQIFNIQNQPNNNQLLYNKNPKFKNIKFIPYLDVVYKHMNIHNLEIINKLSDDIIFFSSYWKNMYWQFKEKKGYILNHCFNYNNYYPIDYSLVCNLLQFNEETFKILNLNRNQPRKQLDVALRGYIYMINKYNLINDNILYIIGTSLKDHWDLIDIIEQEALNYNLDIEKLSKKFQIMDMAQHLSDNDINIYYNACDIGINSCNGEGFGLCNFEHASLGKPQIISDVGSFSEIFDNDNSILIKPKSTIYIPHKEHTLSGEIEICDYKDFGEAMYKYYKDEKLRKTHGQTIRKKILEKYNWNKHIKDFHNYLINI